jgi:uncharacterized protein (TIGR00730 family)
VSISAVCVYCGSSRGSDIHFAEAAADLGRRLAASRLRLIYGGGAVGLMGVIADAAIEAGGEVVGVIPRGLFSREVAHRGLTQLHEVASMHERKQLMFELADAFVALPGGFGTLEELAEVTTWAQLGMHSKPIVIVDLDGFWSPLLQQLDRMTNAGLLKAKNRALIVAASTVADVLPAIAAYDVPSETKWITREQM